MIKNELSKPQRNRFSFSWFVRSRWNILDLIGFLRGNSVATYLFTDIDMSWEEKTRLDFYEQGIKATITAFLIKAIGIAQRAHPDSRAALMPWGQTLIIENIVAGFTCEKEVPGGQAVYIGVIENPDTKSLVQISNELRNYATQDIKDVPQLALEERFNHMPWLIRRIILMVGLLLPWIRFSVMPASFGISSLGKLGITAIIPPCVNTSTFGVGKVEERAVVRNGQIEVRPMMSLTLNFDHRLIDGAPAARFLNDVQKLIEGGLAGYLHEEIPALAITAKEVANIQSPGAEPAGIESPTANQPALV
jgi:hypothetical protein